MNGLRLQGHTLDGARERLSGAEHKPSGTKPFENSTVHIPEMSAIGFNDSKNKNKWHDLSPKQKFATIIASLILFIGAGTAALWLTHKKPGPVAVKKDAVKVQAVPKPTTTASPLSGIQVDPALAARPVTGIMIENSLDARPQSGLQDAGVVYEAIAEGGITRFLTLFQENKPGYVGPVRSLRPYYIDFGAPYQAGIAHVGGSPDALAQIRGGGGLRDLDQFFNSGSYWRVKSRRAPHNVYTSFDKLDALNQKKGYTSSQFTPWKRKADSPLATPTAAHINVNISSALYNSHYDYDKASNSYLRSEGGKPHIATNGENDRTGQQLHPKVVLVLVMSYKVIDRAGHSGYGATGSGPMFVFQDGKLSQGTWSKPDRNSMFEFKDWGGVPIALNAGQTWVVAAKASGNVAYTP